MSVIPDIESKRSESYRIINVAGIFGGIRPSGVEAVIYSETQDITKVLRTQPLDPTKIIVSRIAECELVIDPVQLKSIQLWINQKVADYEKVFGKIPSPEEIESRRGRNDDMQ